MAAVESILASELTGSAVKARTPGVGTAVTASVRLPTGPSCAIRARKGRVEIAEGGSLFLDEIGDMSPSMQGKLLRVLLERVFERVGNHAPIRCNVRIIAATHRNLEEAITRGTFREDLFHRINVFPIEMPPLRSRSEDIPLLVRDGGARGAAGGRGRGRRARRARAAGA